MKKKKHKNTRSRLGSVTLYTFRRGWPRECGRHCPALTMLMQIVKAYCKFSSLWSIKKCYIRCLY